MFKHSFYIITQFPVFLQGYFSEYRLLRAPAGVDYPLFTDPRQGDYLLDFTFLDF